MAYADDIVLISSGKFIDVIVDLSTSVFNSNILNVSPLKTEAVLFSRQNKIPDFDLAEVNGTLETATKFLGVGLW